MSTPAKEEKWVLWDPQVLLYTIIGKSTQCIHGKISMRKNNSNFLFTIIYDLHIIEDTNSM